jgi:hypothetical protein
MSVLVKSERGDGDEHIEIIGGAPVLLMVPIDAVTPIDDALWYVVVTSHDGTAQPASWTVDGTPGDMAEIALYSTLLPRYETLHVWIRTPRGQVFFAPIVITP